MYKKLFPFFLLLLITAMAYGQKTTLSGTIRDTLARANVKNAVVALLTPKDSVLKAFTRTRADGGWSLASLEQGKYILVIMHPHFADYVDDIEIKETEVKLNAIPVTPKSKLLEAVILKSGSPIRIKGDTTIYTADSFKVSANANVEELLKKMPGFQVDKNGQIKSMGEVVEKVLVDGEEFFGDDPGMAVKNLRADAVKEVQVFNKKSEQSEFTGIDDGKTQKTINLKLKEDKKTGYFGKADVAGGLMKSLDDRYNSNMMFSTFKGKRKLSAFLLTGNTGQDGLSWQDNEKYGGESENYSVSIEDDGMMMYSWRGGSSDDEPYVNTENGFIRNVNAGAQYSNKWNDKQTLNFSPKYNSQVYDNSKNAYVQEQLPGGGFLNESSLVQSHINRYNLKSTATYDIKLDSNNNLKFTTRANFYHTESEEERITERKDGDGLLLNNSDGITRIENDKQSYSANMIFKHKFKKARRTLSLTADWNLLNSEGTNFLRSHNQDYVIPSIREVDQMIDNDKSTQKLTSRIVYTEPLTKKYSLELGHEIAYNTGQNNQRTYTYTPATGKYDIGVDSLTNLFDQQIMIHKPNVRITFNDKKIKYNFGSGFGLTKFDLENKTTGTHYKRNYTNFFPSASFNYMYKSNHNLRINYNGYTTQPTINQLQPLRNNTQLYNQYIGNPDLKPSFTNSFNVSHNGYNFLKDLWMYQSFNLRLTSNSITNRVDYDSGKTSTQPINTNGNVSISFWSGLGFKIKKINTRIDISPSINYNKFSDVINGQANFSTTTTSGLNIYLSKTKEKKYEFSLSNNFSYNSNKNTSNNLARHYNINTSSVDATVYIKKVWSIRSDYQYYFRQKQGDETKDLTNQLWNAGIQRTFKNNEFTVYVKVRDLLNQNIGIDRNFYGNKFTETRNDRLRRYWMLGFAWDFKNKGSQTK